MKLSYLWLHTNSPLSMEDTPYLRGFFGNKFKDIPLFHHHLDNTGFIYLYPRIQYKVVEGVPLLVGISEGVSAIQKAMSSVDTLTIKGTSYTIEDLVLKQTTFDPNPTKKAFEYSFITPWMALDQKNEDQYALIQNHRERKECVISILVANV